MVWICQVYNMPSDQNRRICVIISSGDI